MAVMCLIDLATERKINGKTYKTLGGTTWKKLASRLHDETKMRWEPKAVSKKWSNLKSRY